MKNAGTTIERGIVKEVLDGLYRVESYTRNGVTTPALPALPGTAIQAGDRVYYFMFDDGRGLILATFA